MIRIQWIKLNPGASKDEGSYYRSMEGRFHINPTFRGRTWPDSYKITDNMSKSDKGNWPVSYHNDSIRECQAWANRRVEKEIENEI